MNEKMLVQKKITAKFYSLTPEICNSRLVFGIVITEFKKIII
ncbi:hypothetical protein [Orientia tsutsugamushi]|nr:hypothetical protein [Orientia tsutsugamushi]